MGIGFYMKEVITNVFPGKDPVHTFYGIILYYFLIDFLLRIALQGLPTLSIQPYLTLNIRKRAIVNFLNVKTLFSFFNIVPLFIFFPFCFTEISMVLGTNTAITIAVCIVSLIIFNNFFTLWLKRLSSSKTGILFGGVSIVLLLAALDYLRIISVMDFSDFIFSTLESLPYLAIVFLGLAMTAYTVNNKDLNSNFYIEELSVKEQEKTSTDYPFFHRFGRVGDLAATELKLILRHKRSKGTLVMSAIFMCYGLMLYDEDMLNQNQFTMPLFAAIFMTGIFQISYGQYMFAWQSNHFDGLLANRINFVDFMKAKFLLLTLAATIVTMITLLYGFISWKLILIHIAVYLYNIGFGTVIILFFANFNRKKLDLSKGSSFNWQGIGAIQWILGIPLLVLPYLIYLPFGRNNEPYWGLIAIGIFGLITLVMRELWVKWLTQLFVKQRYKISEGFREYS